MSARFKDGLWGRGQLHAPLLPPSPNLHLPHNGAYQLSSVPSAGSPPLPSIAYEGGALFAATFGQQQQRGSGRRPRTSLATVRVSDEISGVYPMNAGLPRCTV